MISDLGHAAGTLEIAKHGRRKEEMEETQFRDSFTRRALDPTTPIK